jgi:hypothetical protein
MLVGMHRGVVYGVIAFGLAVGLCTLACLLARGWPLASAGKIVVTLVIALAVRPLFPVRKARLRGGRRATLGLALLVFAILAGAGGIVVGVVGGRAWIGPAAALAAIAVTLGAAGALVLRIPSGRRTVAGTMRWQQ